MGLRVSVLLGFFLCIPAFCSNSFPDQKKPYLLSLRFDYACSGALLKRSPFLARFTVPSGRYDSDRKKDFLERLSHFIQLIAVADRPLELIAIAHGDDALQRSEDLMKAYAGKGKALWDQVELRKYIDSKSDHPWGEGDASAEKPIFAYGFRGLPAKLLEFLSVASTFEELVLIDPTRGWDAASIFKGEFPGIPSTYRGLVHNDFYVTLLPRLHGHVDTLLRLKESDFVHREFFISGKTSDFDVTEVLFKNLDPSKALDPFDVCSHWNVPRSPRQHWRDPA
jgi:hypothetical protein